MIYMQKIMIREMRRILIAPGVAPEAVFSITR